MDPSLFDTEALELAPAALLGQAALKYQLTLEEGLLLTGDDMLTNVFHA